MLRLWRCLGKNVSLLFPYDVTNKYRGVFLYRVSVPEFDFDEVKEEERIITPRRTPGEHIDDLRQPSAKSRSRLRHVQMGTFLQSYLFFESSFLVCNLCRMYNWIVFCD